MKETSVDLMDNNLEPKILYSVNRNVLKQKEIEGVTGYYRHKNTPYEALVKNLKSLKCSSIVLNLVPVLRWLPKYSFRDNISGDLIAGLTVAIMHIPQGMAYGLLAGLDPIVGLYMAFFPTLIYFIFGTSRHISPGTFAIASIMTSKIVATYSDPNYGTDASTMDPSYSNYQVATAVTMVCGIFQLIMWIFRLGTLTSLLSTALISGFTTGSACHVIVAQSKELLGVTITRYSSAFRVLLSLRDTILSIPSSNLTTVYVSIGCLAFMIIMNEFIKPWASKKCKFPLPAELIAVVGFTMISYFFKLSEDPHNVVVVGNIPTGLPLPNLPTFKLLPIVALDSFAVCIVTYSIVISMALIFAKKDKYEVKANQELLAVGLANIFGSFFQCVPLSCALSRTIIQYQTGGKTQIASVVSAILILILLLWLGPLFETLPRATLAAIIIVALKGMIWQFKDIKKLNRESKLDVAVWIITFLTVIIIDIDIGLLTGVIVSVFVLYVKGFKSYSSMLGQVPHTDIYVDLKTHQNAIEVPSIKIFRFYGSINFATASSFKKNLFDNIGVDHRIIRRASLCEGTSENRDFYNAMQNLIIDLTCVHHIDMSGYRTLLEIRDELKMLDVKVFLAGANDCVYDQLIKASAIGEPIIECFSTLHDAVLAGCALNKIEL